MLSWAGQHYTPILADVGDHLVNPTFVEPRVMFLSDHEGPGVLYSALPDGADVRRHADLGEYYARHATSDGQRVVCQQAGEIWLLESLDARPKRLDIRLSGGRSGRTSPRAGQLGEAMVGDFRRAVPQPGWSAMTWTLERMYRQARQPPCRGWPRW